MLRHCVNSTLLGAFALLLAACSSTSTSVRVPAEDSQISAGAGAFESGLADAAPEVAEQGDIEQGDIPPSNVDLSIEANLDEISERTQRQYDAALAAMNAGDWLQAELELDQLILEEPGFPGPWVNRALIYQRDGRLAEARQSLEQAIAIAPEFAPANNELGRLLRERGEFTAAEAAYRRALAGDPGNAIAHLNLGILLDIYLRRPNDALNHYNQYQATLAEPDETVSRWIVDLERRASAAERVAQD